VVYDLQPRLTRSRINWTRCARPATRSALSTPAKSSARRRAALPVAEVRPRLADTEPDDNQEITFAELCSGFAILALGDCLRRFVWPVSYNVAQPPARSEQARLKGRNERVVADDSTKYRR